MGPTLEIGDIAGVSCGIAGEAGIRGIAEGAQHASDVLEWTLLGAPVRQGTCRLTFEIEDHEIRLRAQDLTEMVVTVNPNALSRRMYVPRRLQALQAYRIVR